MRARILVLAVLLGALVAATVTYAARDATPRYTFELLAHPDAATRGYDADVVLFGGHAYLSSHKGRERCPADGVRIFDLANPRRPRLVGTFADGRSTPTLANSWTEKTIVRRVRTAQFTGDLAVTSVQPCAPNATKGFALYDVTRPAAPKLLSIVPTEPRGSHEIWLAASRGRAWVYTALIGSEVRSSPDGRTPGEPDFRIFDVSDPRDARQIGGWGAWKQLGIRPQPQAGSRARGNFVHSVITNAAATRAYLSYWDLGTVILDISRPSAPRYLGRTATNRWRPANTHSAWLARGGKILLETHERTGGKVAIYDISSERRPRLLSQFGLTRGMLAGRGGSMSDVAGMSLTDSVHDPKARGNIAFFSWYGQGVVAADISNPRRPRFLARYLPAPSRDREELLCPGRRCTSVWGVDVAGDIVVASDLNSGLWVLRLNRRG